MNFWCKPPHEIQKHFHSVCWETKWTKKMSDRLKSPKLNNGAGRKTHNNRYVINWRYNTYRDLNYYGSSQFLCSKQAPARQLGLKKHFKRSPKLPYKRAKRMISMYRKRLISATHRQQKLSRAAADRFQPLSLQYLLHLGSRFANIYSSVLC